MVFVVYGARIGIRVTDPAALDLLGPCLPPLARPLRSPVVDAIFSVRLGGPPRGRGRREFNLLYLDGVQLARTLDLDELLHTLRSSLEAEVGLRARRKLYVHAGVVRWRGRAILVPGRSRTGKSELVAALVAQGATYYSDEYAVLDPEGRVHPFPRPLSLRPRDELPGRPLVPARAVGKSRAPVGAIIVTEFRPGARWRPKLLSPAQGVLALMENTLLARVAPEAVLPVLRTTAMGARVVKSSRGEAGSIARVLLSELVPSKGGAA